MKQPTISSSAVATVVLLLAALWTPAAGAEVYAVNVVDFAFEPADLNIQVGDTVTWTNIDGLHNVAADDSSFTSGPPSTDAWVFSHTFHEGGMVTYRCSQHPTLMIGTVAVEGIFSDRFESGDAGAWSATVPVTPNCDCYFSGDCAVGFCDWGDLNMEDNCFWRENKPNGVPGAGCDVPYDGPWIAGICDGFCSPAALGSFLGWEDRALIDEGIRLWAEALMGPAEAGGGPVDPVLAKRAMALDFKSPQAAITLGRHVADLLVVAGIPGFADHFCHFEGHPGEPDPDLYVDLSGDPCRRDAGWSAVEALLAELDVPGSCAKIIAGIQLSCPDWQEMFGPRCTGDTALACVEERIANLATFLDTPRDLEAYLQQLFAGPVAGDTP